jgi:hypothetical protein
MSASSDFPQRLESKVTEQLKAQRVGYLMGAGSSYLNGAGYPLASDLWEQIKDHVTDVPKRADIQAKLDSGAKGLEHALDLLDDGGAQDTPYRHLVTNAVAELFMPKMPPVDVHTEFVRRVAGRGEPGVKVFSLNYDPLLERAATLAEVRLVDGYLGVEPSFFDATVFEERIGRIRGSYKRKQFEETAKPIHLLKLHGSLGWYECPTNGVRRGAFGAAPPNGTKRLMIPPQRRKGAETMYRPYSALWSAFRGALGQDSVPINRLVCLGYGFEDEHVNVLIEAALARTDFTVLIFAKDLSETAWNRWSAKTNAVVVTRSRCALKGEIGPGHSYLWSFEHIAKEA